MQNQFLTEPETEASYRPPDAVQTEFTTDSVPAQTELATAPDVVQTHLATAETQSVQDTQAVHRWLANIQQKTRRDKIRIWTIYLVLWLAGVLFELLLVVVPFHSFGSMNLLAHLMSYLPWLGIASLGFALRLRKPKWNTDEIAQIGGVQAVGTLPDLLNEVNSPKQSRLLCIALTELLPQMKASDAAYLTRVQCRMLYWSLQGRLTVSEDLRLNLNFRLAILKALKQIGDADAVPIVERIANSMAHTTEQKRLKVVAQECLPLLRVNSGTVEANKTLLRASSLALAAPETLLRSSEFTPDANPKELLHASETTVPKSPPL